MTLKTNKYFKPETIPTLVPLKRVSAKVRREFRDEGISGFPGKSGYGHSPTLAPVPTLNLGTGAKVFKNDYQLGLHGQLDLEDLISEKEGS